MMIHDPTIRVSWLTSCLVGLSATLSSDGNPMRQPPARDLLYIDDGSQPTGGDPTFHSIPRLSRTGIWTDPRYWVIRTLPDHLKLKILLRQNLSDDEFARLGHPRRFFDLADVCSETDRADRDRSRREIGAVSTHYGMLADKFALFRESAFLRGLKHIVLSLAIYDDRLKLIQGCARVFTRDLLYCLEAKSYGEINDFSLKLCRLAPYANFRLYLNERQKLAGVYDDLMQRAGRLVHSGKPFTAPEVNKAEQESTETRFRIVDLDREIDQFKRQLVDSWEEQP